MNLKKQFGYPAKRGSLSAGFTLIELLVVVLIIGILSSVALPQYTKTVKRARAAEAWTIGKTYFDAQNVYMLENGHYASNLEDLSVDIPTNTKNWEVELGAGGYRESGDIGSSWLKVTGKGTMNGISLMYGIGSTDTVLGRSVSCNSSDGYCPVLVPCTTPEIGSGGNYAYCSM